MRQEDRQLHDDLPRLQPSTDLLPILDGNRPKRKVVRQRDVQLDLGLVDRVHGGDLSGGRVHLDLHVVLAVLLVDQRLELVLAQQAGHAVAGDLADDGRVPVVKPVPPPPDHGRQEAQRLGVQMTRVPLGLQRGTCGEQKGERR